MKPVKLRPLPLLAWGEQSHPLLQVLDLNAFRAGGGL